MRIFGSVKLFNIDVAGYSDALKKALELNTRNAARAFLRAAIPRIPVLTGMARGSFLNIGSFLRVAVPISPKLRLSKIGTNRDKWYYPPNGGGRIPKTPESGASLTTQPSEMIKVTNDGVKFQIQSKVFHLTLEDFIGVRSPSAPWGAFEAGRRAFMLEMRKLQKRLPKLSSYITKTTVSFGQGSGITEHPPIRLRAQEKISG